MLNLLFLKGLYLIPQHFFRRQKGLEQRAIRRHGNHHLLGVTLLLGAQEATGILAMVMTRMRVLMISRR